MTINEINNLKILDIVQKRHKDGYVDVGMIVDWFYDGRHSTMFDVMFQTADNGVEIRTYSEMSLYDFEKVV